MGTVTVNGVYHEPARYPNANDADPAATGWLFTEDVVLKSGEKPHPSWEAFPAWDFRFRQGDLKPALFANESEPMILMWDKLGWKSEIYPITVDFNARKVHVDGRIDFGIDDKTRYFIYNVKAALDKPGEFYHDKKNGRLYVIPKGISDLSSATVVASQYAGGPAIRIKGAQGTLINGFQIRDQHNTARWGVNQGGAIFIEGGAKNNIIENNEITSVGTGVWVAIDAGSGNEIRANTIHHVLTDGIRLLGSGGNMAIGNYIHHPGLLERYAKGITSLPVPNRIANNRIEDTPHYGISATSDKGGNGTLIEYNDIRRTNREARDCGAIYLKNNGIYNPSNREIVRYNMISDIGGLKVNDDRTFSKNVTCWGIYLDASSKGGHSGTDIYGNVIIGAQSGAVMLHKGVDNKVYENILIGAPSQQVYESGTFSSSNVFKRNIIAFTSPSGKILGGSPAKNGEGTWDSNLYWRLGDSNSASYFDTNMVTPRGTFPQWRSAGFDKDSKVADPLFTDWKAADYSLQPKSPAFGLGFSKISMEKIGLGG